MKKVMKAVAALMLMTAVVCATGCKKDDDSNNGGNNNGGNNGGCQTNHEYVNLGLPSGTLWASCNIGANVPEEYGDYFAWGETQPKSYYDWSTYEYCNGSNNQLTKYCNKFDYGYNGFTDNLTTLQRGDDAATANWGSGWRMPTRKEWIELYSYTTSTWTTQNGVKGRNFVATNGQTLFLPAAGSYWAGYSVNDVGNYWSSSLDTINPNHAWHYNIYSGGGSMGNYDRIYGRSVRAVRSLK